MTFFGRYVKVELAGEICQSSTIYKTLNPEWHDEQFDFQLEIHELESDDDGNLTVRRWDSNPRDPLHTAHC